MERLSLALGIVGITLVLFGILILIQKRRNVDIPEGFTTEYPTEASINDLANPITTLIKKVGKISMHFANPTVWTDAFETSKLSFTDLARRQIEQDKAAAAAAAAAAKPTEEQDKKADGR
jgi:hypothetical protein